MQNVIKVIVVVLLIVVAFFGGVYFSAEKSAQNEEGAVLSGLLAEAENLVVFSSALRSKVNSDYYEKRIADILFRIWLIEPEMGRILMKSTGLNYVPDSQGDPLQIDGFFLEDEARVKVTESEKSGGHWVFFYKSENLYFSQRVYCNPNINSRDVFMRKEKYRDLVNRFVEDLKEGKAEGVSSIR